MINFDIILKPRYLKLFTNFRNMNTILSEWELLDNLIYLNLLKDGWVVHIKDLVESSFPAKLYIESKEEAKSLPKSEEYNKFEEDGLGSLVLPLGKYTSEEIRMRKFAEQDNIVLTPLCYRNDFAPSIRLLTDTILVDAQSLRCTDVRFDNEYNLDGSYRYVVKFRRGLYLQEEPNYVIDKAIIQDIITDMLSNRSSVKNKLSELYTSSAIRFRLLDPDFPTRCQIARSEGGLVLVVRLLYFGDAPKIRQLGFREHTNLMLESLSRKMNGLSLVSGVFGSGKGTTLNAVGMKMEDEGKFSMASLDDPIEYKRKYPQFEYSNEGQMLEFVEGFKKMDLNAVFLNEIINDTGAKAIYNLVTAGVHVLTTIHTHRVYRLMYKLKELLGDNYLSIIPFLNVISYQDKFSICCPNCLSGSFIDEYDKEQDEYKLLSSLGIEALKQPLGCSKCESGIIKSGINVVSEHIIVTESIKTELLKLDLNQQFDYLRDLIQQGDSLEKEVAEGIRSGKILISEALEKLDNWR